MAQASAFVEISWVRPMECPRCKGCGHIGGSSSLLYGKTSVCPFCNKSGRVRSETVCFDDRGVYSVATRPTWELGRIERKGPQVPSEWVMR